MQHPSAVQIIRDRNHSECMKYIMTKLKSLATLKCNITVGKKIHNMQEHKQCKYIMLLKKTFQNTQRSRSSTLHLIL
jgi:hypothetical protein